MSFNCGSLLEYAILLISFSHTLFMFLPLSIYSHVSNQGDLALCYNLSILFLMSEEIMQVNIFTVNHDFHLSWLRIPDLCRQEQPQVQDDLAASEYPPCPLFLLRFPFILYITPTCIQYTTNFTASRRYL